MSAAAELVREGIRRLRPYRNAEFEAGMVRLNANEAPWPPPGDSSAPGLNRYPEPRPFALTARLAAHYGVDPSGVLVTRGSSEAIDVVTRAYCPAGASEVVICPPTFGMYEVYAQIQGAGVVRVPLRRNDGYALDVAGIRGAWTDRCRVLFVCSPNNPTGNALPTEVIAEVARAIGPRGVVVVDAAYAEFAPHDPTRELLAAHDNVLVLRTLSKAFALAGVRCGVLLGPPDAVTAVGGVLPPYCFPSTSVEAVMRCFEPGQAEEWARRIGVLRAERQRLIPALARVPGIRRVWPSDANFILIEAEDAAAVRRAAHAAGVLVRDFGWDPLLPGCIRITVGTPEENDRLLGALE